MPLARALAADADAYDAPRFGNVSVLHFTDSHAQLRPLHFREPSVNLGVGDARGRPPHVVGEALLRAFGIAPGTRDAHALTYLDFNAAAKRASAATSSGNISPASSNTMCPSAPTT